MNGVTFNNSGIVAKVMTLVALHKQKLANLQ
jgi:hypothetical protein